MHIKAIVDTKCLILEVIVSKMNLDNKKSILPRCNAIYEDKVLTALLFDGGYVSLDFIRPFLAMPKLKLASLWSFGLTKTLTKSGTGIHATYTPTYHFYMKDHLGSNHVVASTTGEAEQVTHYYPYGSTF